MVREGEPESRILLLEGLLGAFEPVILYGIHRFIDDGTALWDVFFHATPPVPLAALPVHRFLVIPVLASATLDDARHRAAQMHLTVPQLRTFGWLDSSVDVEPARALVLFTVEVENDGVVFTLVQRYAITSREDLAEACGPDILSGIDAAVADVVEAVHAGGGGLVQPA